MLRIRGTVGATSWAFTAAALAAAVGGCGSASTDGGHTTSPLAVRSAERADLTPAAVDLVVDSDQDNDVGASHDDLNNRLALDFGHPANSADRHAITALVKRYYRVALAGQGRKGCSMLYPSLAEAAPEDDSREPGTPAYMQNANSCTEVLDDLFRHYHAQLATELPKLNITRVRVRGYDGFAFLSFGALAQRKISVIRTRRGWNLSQIYDEELP